MHKAETTDAQSIVERDFDLLSQKFAELAALFEAINDASDNGNHARAGNLAALGYGICDTWTYTADHMRKDYWRSLEESREQGGKHD